MPKDKGFWIEKNGERVWSKKEDKPFNSMPEPLKERNGIIIWNDWDKEKPYLVRWYQLERKFDSVEKAERYIDELTGGKGGPMQSSHLYRNGAESIEKRKNKTHNTKSENRSGNHSWS